MTGPKPVVIQPPDPKLVDSLSSELQVTTETPPTFLWHTDADSGRIETDVAQMEFERMFSDPLDPNACFLDLQAGSR